MKAIIAIPCRFANEQLLSMTWDFIESIERCTTIQDYDIVIYDNNSKPLLSEKFRREFTGRIVYAKEFNMNKFWNETLNIPADVYIFSNNDMKVWNVGWLANIIRWFRQKPELGIIIPFQSGRGYNHGKPTPQDILTIIDQPKPMPLFAIRKECAKDIYPFDERFAHYWSDIDTFHTCRAKNWKVGMAHDVLVEHFGDRTTFHDPDVLKQSPDLCQEGPEFQRQHALLQEKWKQKFPFPAIPDATVDVCIVTFNRLTLLKRSIASVRQAKYPYNLLVWDNGSTDGTASWLRRNKHWFQLLILSSSNVGKGSAANFLMRYGTSEYIFAMDDDLELPQAWLYKLVKAYQQIPNVGLLAVNLDGPHWGKYKRPGAKIPCSCGIQYGEFTFEECGAVCGAGWLMKRSYFKLVGGYKEDVLYGGIDGEYVARFRRKNLRVGYLREVLATHYAFSGYEKYNQWKQDVQDKLYQGGSTSKEEQLQELKQRGII